MKKIITILLLFFSQHSFSQGIKFEKYLEDSISFEVTSVCTVGTNYILLCNKSIGNFDQNSPFIYMLDSVGNILFKKEYDFNYQTNFLHVERTKDNKLIFVGTIDSLNSSFSSKMDGLVMITDSLGELISSHVFAYPTNTYLYHILLEDSAFYVIGRRYEANSIRHDIVVIKSDYNYNFLDSTIINKQKYDFGFRINKALNRKYLICGQLFDNVGTTSFYSMLNSNLDSIYLKKFWRMIDQDSNDIALWVTFNSKMTKNKHIILSNVFKTKNPLIPNPPINVNYERIGLMKLDSLGNLLKTMVYYNLNSIQDRPVDVFENNDGGFTIPGTFEFNSNFATTNKPNGNFYLIKVDSLLNRVWDKQYGNADYQEMKAALPTKDGGMIMVGSTYNNTRKIKNGYVVKTYASGNATNINNIRYNKINLYPNPVSDNIYFNSEDNFNNYKIYDVLGNVIDEGLIQFKHIPVINLKSGIYIIELFTNSQTVYRNKFIKN